MAQTDSGFATCDISEVRAITGQESPGIGCAYNAFSGGYAGSESAAGFRGARSDCLCDRLEPLPRASPVYVNIVLSNCVQ
jgi:hypothetical protein